MLIARGHADAVARGFLAARRRRERHRLACSRVPIVAGLLIGLAAQAGPASSTASAHGETTPVIQTVVDGVSAPASGVVVTTDRAQQSHVALQNSSATELVVVGDLGEPFLRIGPAGTFANVNSPTWYGSGNPDGVALNLPTSAHVGAPPHWRALTSQPRWSWFDRRVEPPANPISPQARAGRKPVRLVDWSIPLRYGAHSARVYGHVEFRPAVGAVIARISSLPVTPSLTVAVLGGASPGLFLANSGHDTVTVIGSDDRPFARIGPDGVSVNTNSPTFVAGEVAAGQPISAVPADAAPSWRMVSSVPRYGWVDPRLRYGSLEPPADVVRQTHVTVLKHWSITIQTSAGARRLAGTTSWVPLEQPGDNTFANPGHSQRLLWSLLVAAAVTTTTALGALTLRRGRERAHPHRAGSAG